MKSSWHLKFNFNARSATPNKMEEERSFSWYRVAMDRQSGENNWEITETTPRFIVHCFAYSMPPLTLNVTQLCVCVVCVRLCTLFHCFYGIIVWYCVAIHSRFDETARLIGAIHELCLFMSSEYNTGSPLRSVCNAMPWYQYTIFIYCELIQQHR